MNTASDQATTGADENADAVTAARIAAARRSAATTPALDRLRWRSLGALIDARAREGDAPFLIYVDDAGVRSELSRHELLARVAARARTLRAAGVARGKRVATLLHNHPDAPITAFAAFRLGASLVPINTGEDDDRLAYVIEHSGACVVVVHPEYAARSAALRARLAARGITPQWVALAETRETIGAAIDVTTFDAPGGEDEALVVYTSGTTGAPKGVVLTQENLLVDAQAIADWHGFEARARWMCVLPVHHVNGLVVTLLTPFLAGGSTVLLRRFRTRDFWRRIDEEGVQVVSVVPTLLAFLLEDPTDHDTRDLRRFRYLICGAGPLTVELARRFEERFGRRIVHGYGLSETTCYSCFLPVDLDPDTHAHWMQAFGFPSIGVPLPPNEMAIHDSDGRPLGPRERGEIVIRGVNVMRGYFRRPEANAEAFAHEWFRSGDEGFFERDAQGRSFFFITGRIKELIIRGGVNLSPFEIDEVLDRVPGVRCGLAVGFENDWYGEEVGAFVQREPDSNVSEEEILAACRSALPFAKAPKVVVFGDDVPVTATGKYQRGRLRSLFAAWKATQFRAPRGG